MSKAFFGNVKRDEPNVTYVFVLVTFDFARTDFGSAVHFNCTSTVNVNTKYDGLPAGTRADCAAQTHSSKV